MESDLGLWSICYWSLTATVHGKGESIMSKFIINAAKMPDLEGLAAGETPMVLLRWPKGTELPAAIKQKLEEEQFQGIPTVNLNLQWTGAAVNKFREVVGNMLSGARYSVQIDYEPDGTRLTGGMGKDGVLRYYLQIDPSAVYLNKIEEVPPVWVGGSTTDADEALAKAINIANALAAKKRIDARRATPSGSPMPDHPAPMQTVAGGGEVVTGSDISPF
jgi:hypothetical protein